MVYAMKLNGICLFDPFRNTLFVCSIISKSYNGKELYKLLEKEQLRMKATKAINI